MKTPPQRLCVVFERTSDPDAWEPIFVGDRDAADDHESSILADDPHARTLVLEFERATR
jgi:hypothetical protein